MERVPLEMVVQVRQTIPGWRFGLFAKGGSQVSTRRFTVKAIYPWQDPAGNGKGMHVLRTAKGVEEFKAEISITGKEARFLVGNETGRELEDFSSDWRKKNAEHMVWSARRMALSGPEMNT